MMTQGELREVFEYRDGKLFNKYKRCGRAMPGREAGTINKVTGYKQVYVHKRLYSYAHLVWIYHHGEINGVIDHIDRNKLNNSINNLRDTSYSVNALNKESRGYCFLKHVGKWNAYITIEGKRNNLGYFNKEKDAKMARQNAERIYNESYAH